MRVIRLVSPVAALSLVMSLLSLAGVASAATPGTTTPDPSTGVQPTNAENFTRPDLPSAQLAARLLNHRIEVSGLETETTTTYVNPNGSLTTDSSSTPIRKQVNGGWRPVDPALVPVTGGFAPTVAKIGVVFSGGGSGPLYTVTTDSGTLSVRWPGGPLPAPIVTDDTATYPGVQPGVDLVLTAGVTGFDMSFVLNRRPTVIPSFPLMTAVDGLTPTVNPDGALSFNAGNGSPQLLTGQADTWDSTSKLGAGHRNRAVVSGSSFSKASRVWNIAPDAAFLLDPATTYPVTIDPPVDLVDNGYGFVSSAHPSTSYVDNSASEYGYSGVVNVGSSPSALGYGITRGYYNFDTSSIKGQSVSWATLTLGELYSGASDCTATTVGLYNTASFDGTHNTWNTQPYSYGLITQQASALGGDPTYCPTAGLTFNVTSEVAGWASNAHQVNTLGVFAANESDPASFKVFGGWNQTLSVTYSGIPSLPAGRTTSPCAYPDDTCGLNNGLVWTNSLTPTVRAESVDPNSAVMTMNFQVAAGTSVNPSSDVVDGAVGGLGNGQFGVWEIATPTGQSVLSNGGTYEWRAQACNSSTNCSVWSSWVVFTVDTTAPGYANFLSSSTPNGYTTQDSGEVLWTSPADGVSQDCYFDGVPCGWQGSSTSSYVDDMSSTSHVQITSASGGQHDLEVDTYDIAGNMTENDWVFTVGGGVLSTPGNQGRTQQYVPLSGYGPVGHTWVDVFYRPGNTGTFQLLPISDLSLSGTNHQALPAGSSWPMNTASAPWTSSIVWNMLSSVGQDGLVQVYACFYSSQARAGSSCSQTNSVQLTTHAFGESNATRTVGPGTVALLTGDYSISATDVSVPSYRDSLTVGRTFTTLAPTAATGAAGVFGPGWRAAFYGPSAGHADATFKPSLSSGYITLVDADGTEELYQGSDHGAGSVFSGVADTAATGSKITETSATVFTLTEEDGTQTVYTNANGIWGVTQVVESSGKPTATTTKYTLDSAGRISQVLAPVPDGVTCTNPTTTPGCRTLQFTYATTTTASGSTFGDYAGQLSAVTFTSYDPVAGAMANVVVQKYAYDSTGHLRQAWDPRITPNLVATYTYDANGRLATVTAPGLATTTLGYDSQGRIRAVSHPDPSGATATSTIVYGDQLPIDATGPIDMTAAATGTWGEGGPTPSTSTPTTPITAAAIFSPDHVPAAVPTAADWPYAQLVYLDVNGREVNTASYGNSSWQIAATQYDAVGNSIWSITPGNLAQARTPTDATDPAVQALPTVVARANALASLSYYSVDGTELLSTYGPTHPVQSAAAGLIDGREHTTNTYDEGAPGSGGPYRLVTTTVRGVRPLNGTADYDAVTTNNGYNALVSGDVTGWVLHKPTSVTTVMAGTPNITTYTRYNNAGQVVEARQPMGAATAGAGTDAYTTVTAYYTATGSGPCFNAALAGLVCSVGPAAQPTTGKPLPVAATTYNLYDQPLVTTETAGSVARATTTTYDAAGRKTGTATTMTPAGADGAEVPSQTFSYDPTTGLATTTSDSTGKSVTTGYDNLGRVHTYTDATGATTTTSYDIDGRPATITDANGTITYTYDGVSGEHRGVVTALTDSAAGSFTGSYDNDGKLATQTYPNGLVATYGYDNAGGSTGITYADNGVTWLSFAASRDGQGRIASGNDAAGVTTSYGYDNAGRLISATDNTGTSCVQRAYGFNADTDRTSMATSSFAATNGACTGSGTPVTVTHGYDQADRLTDTGYSYDDFGRTLSVPSADAGGNGDVAIGYYTNDLVHTLATTTTGGQASTTTYGLDPAGRIASQTVDDGTGGGSGGGGQVGTDGSVRTSAYGTSVLHATLSTTQPGDLLVAVISMNGTGQSATVSGGGLAWTLLERANAQPGTTEIWTARAPNALTNTSISGSFSQQANQGFLNVYAFTNAGGIGAHGAASGSGSQPSVTLAGLTAGSIVRAAGSNVSSSAQPTPYSGFVSHVTQDTTGGAAYWTQQESAVTATTGSQVIEGDSAPVGQNWNVAAYEVVPGPSVLATTNHYGDGTDSPTWTTNPDASTTRYVVGLDGNMDATVSHYSDGTTSTTLQLVDLHGDVAGTADAAGTGLAATYTYDEFGNATNTNALRYGWLGGKRRAQAGVANLTLMGVRLYDPTSGRFLQTDPVPGGSANAYDYCNADPINCYDLEGTWPHVHWKKIWKKVKKVTKRTAVAIAAGAEEGAHEALSGFVVGFVSGCIADFATGCLPGAVVGGATGASAAMTAGFFYGVASNLTGYRGPSSIVTGF